MRFLKGPLDSLPSSHGEQCTVSCVVSVRITLQALFILPPEVFAHLTIAVATNFWDEGREGQSFIISRDALMARIVKLPCVVEIEDVAEDVWVMVKEILLGL